MTLIRVGFVLGEVSWLGGVNYFRNLFRSIAATPGISVRPVIFVGPLADVEPYEGLADVVRVNFLARHSKKWFARKLQTRLYKKYDFLLNQALMENGIDLVFHFGTSWHGAAIPAIGWIPDFQHLYYPDFFSKKENDGRDEQFENIVDRCEAVVLSSNDALEDLRRSYQKKQFSAYVLHFVSSLNSTDADCLSKHALRKKYSLEDAWFHVPNQFWVHKNHSVLIEALKVLRDRGQFVQVVSTGKQEDYRNPEYFSSLMKIVHAEKLTSNFRPLGIVPYDDVVGLMRHSVAVINPSLFEGWSTSVEEAKAMGKVVLLSDIAVHQEQGPARGKYFGSHDAETLAELMVDVQSSHDALIEIEALNTAALELESRKRKFARDFESMCIEVIQKSKQRKGRLNA